MDNNKRSYKKSLNRVLVIVFALIFALSLAGCGDKGSNNDSQNSSDSVASERDTNDSKDSSSKDSSKGSVSSSKGDFDGMFLGWLPGGEEARLETEEALNNITKNPPEPGQAYAAIDVRFFLDYVQVNWQSGKQGNFVKQIGYEGQELVFSNSGDHYSGTEVIILRVGTHDRHDSPYGTIYELAAVPYLGYDITFINQDGETVSFIEKHFGVWFNGELDFMSLEEAYAIINEEVNPASEDAESQSGMVQFEFKGEWITAYYDEEDQLYWSKDGRMFYQNTDGVWQSPPR